MYGVVIEVKIEPNREEEARTMLNNVIVPRAKNHQGIVAGYWLRDASGDILRTVELFDTESNANKHAERIRTEGPPPGAPVSLVSVNTCEVIAKL